LSVSEGSEQRRQTLLLCIKISDFPLTGPPSQWPLAWWAGRPAGQGQAEERGAHLYGYQIKVAGFR